MLRCYLKQGTPIESTTAYDGKGKPNGMRYLVQLGQSKTDRVSFEGGLPYIWDVEISELFSKRLCAELEEMTEQLSLQADLPNGCHREDGFYQVGAATARVLNRDAPSGKKWSGVLVLAPTLQAMKQMWQALLDGSVRPVRPLFNKEQQGPSYIELVAMLAVLRPKLKEAMLKLSDAESTLIHLSAVVRSCSDVLAQQRSEIDRAIAERDDAMRQLAALQG